MNLLFLYTEVSGYFMACAEKLAELSGATVHVLRWQVNSEAPFVFAERKNVVLHERTQFNAESLLTFCQKLSPDLVYVAGRIDKDYLAVAKYFHKKSIPVVLGFDTPWTGSLKQKISGLLAPYLLQNRFTHVWIPGKPQYPLAKKLGYDDGHILNGVYSGEIAPFLLSGENSYSEKKINYPHVLLFCGRLVEAKGISLLVKTFIELKNSMSHDWKLMIVGTGPLETSLPANEAVEMRGFLQPEKLPLLVPEVGAFILPSLYEPWGVALHEFAAGSLPILASAAVGASTAFLEDGKNGFLFKPGDQNSLEMALNKLFLTKDDELRKMGERSRILSLQLTPETWAHTFLKLLDK